jgi:hypothetical protein
MKRVLGLGTTIYLERWMMPSPAFLVDRHMEVRILGKICPGAPARRLNINGSDVAIPAIAKRAGSLIRLLNNRYHPIFIKIDREGRSESAEEVEKELFKMILAEGVGSDQVVVSVCDRMIENWILADEELLLDRYGVDFTAQSEGNHGKRHLSELVKSRHEYHETTVGVELFCALSARRIVVRSQSFERLSVRLANVCDWIGR